WSCHSPENHDLLESFPISLPLPMELDSTIHCDATNNLGLEKPRQLDFKNRACFKCLATGHQIRNCANNTYFGSVTSQ
ncbi:hypothetical protein BGZ95_008102, partial [Linnemannia exigua]